MQKIALKKWHILTIAAVAAIVLVVLIIRGCGASIKMAYDYETLSRGDVKKTISATGTLDLANTTVVKSRISGEVLQISADYNQNVRRGQLLLLIRADDVDRAVLLPHLMQLSAPNLIFSMPSLPMMQRKACFVKA